jgi:hypothetical protein
VAFSLRKRHLSLKRIEQVNSGTAQLGLVFLCKGWFKRLIRFPNCEDLSYTACSARDFPLSLWLPRQLIMATQLNRKRAYDHRRSRTVFISRLEMSHGCAAWNRTFCASGSRSFPQLKPNKSGTGQRLYRRRDVELAMEIKRLVHAEGYTLSGARTVLDAGASPPRQTPQRQEAGSRGRPGAACEHPKASRWMPWLQSSAMPAPSCVRSPTCWPLHSQQPARRRSRSHRRFRPQAGLAVSDVDSRQQMPRPGSPDPVTA